MIRDLKGKAVLITGGTRGIGLETAIAFGRLGAACVLTYRWGSADEAEIFRRFEAIGARPPLLVPANVGEPRDTAALMAQLAQRFDHLDSFICNVTNANLASGLDDLDRRALNRTMDYSLSPAYLYLQAIRRQFKSLPKYMVVLSTTGIDHYTMNYAMVAAAKAALEALCRYISYDLRDEDFRLNVVRTLGVRTDSFQAAFGEDFEAFLLDHMDESRLVKPEEVAGVVLALCSGLFDALKGEVLTVDKGALFADNIAGRFERREQRPPPGP